MKFQEQYYFSSEIIVMLLKSLQKQYCINVDLVLHYSLTETTLDV